MQKSEKKEVFVENRAFFAFFAEFFEFFNEEKSVRADVFVRLFVLVKFCFLQSADFFI